MSGKNLPDAKRCGAANRSGNRCGLAVIPGARVCYWHGGAAPQVRRAAERRLALAQALQADPRRDPVDVLADVAHQADFLMRRAREELRTNSLTAATMQRLMNLTETAGRWAKTGIEVGIAERQTRALEAQAGAIALVIQRILDRLDLTEAQRALIPVVVPAELERMSGSGSGSDDLGGDAA